MDYGQKYGNGRLPMLDIEVWIGEDCEGETKILHSHFMKPVASRYLIMERSAHGWAMKKNVMINEICRILKNCSVYLSWDRVTEVLSYFVMRMAYSGYPVKFRFEVMRLGLDRHQKKVERWKSGGSIYYCEEEEIRNAAERGSDYEMKWYKKGGRFDSIMFVQPTYGGELRKQVQKIARESGLKIKVVEKAGVTVKSILQRSNPFGKKRCERVDCKVCEIGVVGECRSRGCGYELVCKEDGKKYVGQTGISVYERTKEEWRGWQNHDNTCPLWRHSEENHGGGDFEVEIRVTDRSFGKPSRRLITEAVRIEEVNDCEAMNSKMEWTYTNLNKVNVA